VNNLYRELAPLSTLAWTAVEDEARRSLQHFLAARRLFPLFGPHGYEVESVATGEVASTDEIDGVRAAVMQPRPMVELRTPFTLSRRDIEVLDRGGDAELDPVVEASRRIAAAEDRIVFDGLTTAGIKGVAEASPHTVVPIADFDVFPSAVARAVNVLRSAGVDGPYALALGTREYGRVYESTEPGGSYPVLKHLRLIVDGPLVWSPTTDGAIVVSMRGDDFELHSGLDFAIRYVAHDRDTVELELVETITFRNLGPDAAICIR
jgi:uncharacterized linocin/CFP29 family protein